MLNFNIAPFKTGSNTFNLDIYYVNNTVIESIRNVFLEFNNPDKNLRPLIDNMKKVGLGNYSSIGNYLSQEGKWEMKITVKELVNTKSTNESMLMSNKQFITVMRAA